MASLVVDLLGGFVVRSRGRSIRLPRRKAQALLAYLALNPDHRLSREAITALLWGDVPEEQARHSLRQTLLELRHALPREASAAIVVEGNDISLDPRGVEVDVVAFERLAAEDNRKGLEAAAALYRGAFLEGLTLNEPAFEDWVRAERHRLRETAIQTLRALLARQAADEDVPRAIETAMRLLAIDPLAEPAHRALMRLYDRTGRRVDALRQYERCVETLRRELGVSPELETRRLHDELIARERAAPAAEPRAPREAPRPSAHDFPLVGREEELDRIRAALLAVGRGRGQVLLLSGEAGIGKTRLLEELAGEAQEQGFAGLIGRCYNLTRVIAFGPWIEALRTAALHDRREVLESLGTRRRAELSRLLPELGDPSHLAPQRAEDQIRLFDAIVDLAEVLAARQPVAIMLEDIHWADDMSVRLLFYLGRRLKAARVLLAATFRDDELAQSSLARGMLEDFNREWPAARIVLSPLSRNHVVALAHAIAGTGGPSSTVEQVGAQVWELSQGNPFMIVETMRALPAEPADAAAWPRSRGIADLVERRLRQLDEVARGIVALVSVAGRDIEFDVIRHAAQLSERDTADTVERLIRRRILQDGGDRYDFVHDIVREAAGRQLIAPQRRALHRAVAEALEAVRASALDLHLGALAAHYLEAEVWDRAVSYLARAARQAVERSAWKEALDFIERATEALRQLPESADTQRQFIDLMVDRYATLLPLGLLRHGGRTDDLVRAHTLAESLHDEPRLCRVDARLAHCRHAAGDPEAAKGYARRAILAGEAGGDAVAPTLARHILAEILHFEGDDEQTIAVARQNIDVLSGNRVLRYPGHSGLAIVSARMYLVWSLARQGQFDEALRCAHQTFDIADLSEYPYSLSLAYYAASGAYLWRGDLDHAIPYLERGRQLSLTRVRGHRAGFASMLGTAYTFAGRIDEAIPLLEEGANPELMAYVTQEPHRLAPLARGYSAAGRHDDARRAVERGLGLARTYRSSLAETWLLVVLAAVALDGDPPDIARSIDVGLNVLARSLAAGTRPLSAQCRLILGRAHWANGDISMAEGHLNAAAEMFKAMEMPHWIDVSARVWQTLHAS